MVFGQRGVGEGGFYFRCLVFSFKVGDLVGGKIKERIFGIFSC